ncbi:MAG: tRNA (N6-isopentenyl adenosine(37)-C2)-methylthiotransferase MiaB [[Eubacterium] sulci]|nr:tRNA (N6-isopentenyl adenosine(37)-C2)-methylthiotransferase MiaB [[Eubacterium] sulci]MBF1155852.1 tRNA (N6-isopentenyl adenosine(37)-C2)-methylthiotransferase MiaB [[Eubacterium] sulci]MBF1162054.1 tRNA (N6-isopentenyl adenosine(37)-C2)-methylthiotransferase MiaB [[Eubacterium] sulci]MBF1178518.1 tRNA (N6-isopentenyl adenosine(37)-C2)-methylthiotransferase MiaB [[Eubacterium] sulci]MBF1182475.1 tRNA (N6-isopentenyl adenosine(37)-C2)-methylthiotransferase MiaB [[Eubacterium] sulci]
MSRTFHITTFGCQMNEHDSEVIDGLLTERGFSSVKERKDASIVIINTCSVRDNADKRFFGTLGQLKKRKESDPSFIVCVCGCMMQQQRVVDTIKAKYPWVDVIFGTNSIHHIPELIEKVAIEKEKVVDIIENTEEIVEGLPAKRLFDHKALVNIMFGCNNFCTYCIVPYTRGREKSRAPESIVDEVKVLVADGVKEIMLLGQNVNSYDGNGTSFAELLKMLNDVDGLERIRFMTSNPKDLSDELIEAFAVCDKLCRNLHLPIQSGSNRVLKRMNRKYTREDYLKLIEKLRKTVPDITLSTDIIVGFPGETNEDFEETLSIVKEVEYDSAFTFIYSIRKGTPAEKFEDQIEESEKHRRFDLLVNAVNEISEKKNKAYQDRVEKVLVDGVSKNDKSTLTGRTDGFKLVNFAGKKELIGSLVDVKITDAKTFSLFGEVIE